MKDNLKKIERYVYSLVAITFIIILVASAESLMLAKSKELMDVYLDVNPGSNSGEYLNLVLLNFFMAIFEPIVITLYSFFTYKKYKFGKTYKLIFSALLGLRIFNTILTFRTSSIFYYIIILLYLIMLALIINSPEKKGR